MSNLIKVDVLEDRNPDELSVTEKGKPSASRKKEVVETDFVELRDGTLAELLEDPTDPSCTSLGIWRHGELQYCKNFEHEGRIFVPSHRNNEVLRQIRLPTTASPFESPQALLRKIQTLIYKCVHIEDYYIAVLASFVLATWFVDRFWFAPYLSVVGLPQSGKTILLQVLSLVCRRSLLISDITSSSFYMACTQFSPTILIDEAATIANDRQLRHMLRAGTTRDAIAVRADHTFCAYGAKVLSWPELPDDPALNSRCILIPMSETTQTNLSKPNDPEVERLAMALRSQLLQYRFENFSKIKSLPIKGDETLRPRPRDFLRVLSAASLQDSTQSQSLFNFFRYCYAVPLESLRVDQNAVLLILFRHIHKWERPDSISVGNLTKIVNDWLKSSGERLHLRPRKVGAILTRLGLKNRSRGNSGYYIHFDPPDQIRIHDLLKTYGIDQLGEHLVEYYVAQGCRLCRQAVS